VKESRPNPLGLPDLIKPAGWVAPSHAANHGILSSAWSDAIEARAMAANKARTDILAEHPEINSEWSPNAKHLMEMEDANLDGIIDFNPDRMDIIGQNGNDGLHYESTTIDFTKDSEYIRLYGETKTDNTES